MGRFRDAIRVGQFRLAARGAAGVVNDLAGLCPWCEDGCPRCSRLLELVREIKAAEDEARKLADEIVEADSILEADLATEARREREAEQAQAGRPDEGGGDGEYPF
jgi:hypothetical protein